VNLTILFSANLDILFIPLMLVALAFSDLDDTYFPLFIIIFVLFAIDDTPHLQRNYIVNRTRMLDSCARVRNMLQYLWMGTDTMKSSISQKSFHKWSGFIAWSYSQHLT